MNKAFFFPDQRVADGDMNFIETSRADAVRQQFAFMLARFAHQYTGTIASIAQQTLGDLTPNVTSYRGIGGGLNSDYLLPITGSLSQISVNRGWGITDGMDIVILTGSVTINQGDSTFNKVWGTLTNGQPAYVTAEYQESSASVGSDADGNIYYKRYTGDFLVRVSASYPSGSNQIVLAQFTANGDLVTTNTFQDKREWARPWGVSDSILDKSPVVAALTTLYDHTHAVGTGVPAATNPHGLSLTDLGFTDSLVSHRTLEHGNGIIITDKTISGTLQSYSASIVSPTSNAFLSFNPPTAATASINGVLFSGSLPSLSAATVGNGVYWVVTNQAGTTSFISTGSIMFDDLNPVRNPQYLLLGQATVADAGDDITAFTDLRYIYTMSPAEIRAVFTASVPTSFGKTSSLYDDIAMIHGHLGLITTGSIGVYPESLPLNIGAVGSIKGLHNQFSQASDNGPLSANNRFVNTVYQNTLKRSLFVTVAANLIVDGTLTASAFIFAQIGTDSGFVTNVNVGAAGTVNPIGANGNASQVSTISFVVPPDYYYHIISVVDPGGTVNLEYWSESS